MKTARLLALPLWLGAGALAAQSTITLEQLRQAALAHAPATKDKQLQLDAGALKAKDVNQGWLPQVQAVAQGTYQSEVTEFDLSALGFPAITISPDQYHAGLEVQQTLYEFGATKARHDLALTQAQSAAAQSDVELHQVTGQVDKLYANLLLQQANLKVLHLRAGELDARLRQVSSAVRNGVSLRSNEEVLKAEILATRQQVLSSETAISQTVGALAVVTGMPLDTAMQFALPEVPAETATVERPELRAFSLQQAGTDLQAKLLKKANLPHLAAFGNGYYGRPGFNFLNNDFRPYGIAGVGLQWNIAGFYTQGRELKENAIQRQLIDDRRQRFELQQAADLDREAKEIAKLDGLEALDSAIVASKTFVRKTAESQLDNGTITAQDYVTYQNAQDQALLNLEMHRIQAVMARIEHQHTIGN